MQISNEFTLRSQCASHLSMPGTFMRIQSASQLTKQRNVQYQWLILFSDYKMLVTCISYQEHCIF